MQLALFALLACVPLVLAASVQNPAYDADCIAPGTLSGQSSMNLFPSTFQIRSDVASTSSAGVTKVTVAQNFAVSYYDRFKVVTVLSAGVPVETYVLIPCGSPAPNISEYQGIPKTAKVFTVPLRALAVPDTTPNAFLKALEVQDRIAYSSTYSVDPCMQALASPECGKGFNKNSTAYDAYFTWESTTDAKSILFQASADPGALNRAEYFKFLAPFFNKEALANKLFDGISQQYNDLKTAAAAAGKNKTKPAVAWIAYTADYGASSPEAYQVYGNPYRMQYMQDAGGRPLNITAMLAQLLASNLTSADVKIVGGRLDIYNLTKNAAVLKTVLKGIQLVIDNTLYKQTNPSISNFVTTYGFTDADLTSTDFPFLTAERVLNTHGVVSPAPDFNTIWFEDAIAFPNLVLQDIVAALNPSALSNNQTLTYAPAILRPLTTSSGARLVTAATCPLQAGCVLAAAPICPTVYKDCNGTLKYSTATTAPCAPACPTAAPAGNSSVQPQGSAPARSSAHGGARMLALPLVTLVALLSSALLMAMA